MHTRHDTAQVIPGKGACCVMTASDRDADPATLAARARSHREIEDRLHRVRDVTYHEDKSLVRTGDASHVMASSRRVAISLPRLDGHASIAAANRHHARDPQRTLNCFRLHERDFAVSLICHCNGNVQLKMDNG